MPPKRKAQAPLSGCTFCITGKLSMTRAAFVEVIEDNGGQVASTVTKAVTHLVSASSTTQKAIKAKDAGVDIVDEAWVMREIDGENSTAKSKKKKPAAKKPAAKKKATKKRVAEEEEEEEEEAEAGNALSDFTFCITGTLTVTRSKFAALIKENGGSVASSVTNSVTHLVSAATDTEKAIKAKAKGIDIVDEAWVRRVIDGGAAPAPKKPSAAKASKASKAAKAAAAKKKKAEEEEEEEEEEDEEEVEEEEEEEEKNETTVTVKGGAAVDKFFPSASSYHVYSDASGPWAFTGNQTNIGHNNNKFYILQLLESDSGKNYQTWTRWGRVGANGQNKILPGGTLDACKASFKKKFTDKTRNHWDNKNNFKFSPGKYDMVMIDYGGDDEDAKAELEAEIAKKKGAKRKESSLPKPVKSLMQLIFDTKSMTQAVVEMKYDIKKMPLGKLTPQQIKQGHESLKELDSLISKGASRSQLETASSLFYTRIPHSFGMKRPPLITTLDEVKEKLQLLEALQDIKVALSLIKAGQHDTENAKEDINYKSLKCAMDPIEHDSDTWKMVHTYMKNTHASTHNQYKLELVDLFDLDKATGYKGTAGNKMLLWHGSRLTNWAGILSQGLRIAPPEAPCTGYMFGKGVYFADMVSKSANYCFTSRTKNTGILLLCEVALGKQNELLEADCYLHDHQPKGTHSTWGKGSKGPDPKELITIDGDVKVPLGKGIETGVKNPRGYTLQYNEFIVYNTSQIRFRYLLRVKFNYK